MVDVGAEEFRDGHNPAQIEVEGEIGEQGCRDRHGLQRGSVESIWTTLLMLSKPTDEDASVREWRRSARRACDRMFSCFVSHHRGKGAFIPGNPSPRQRRVRRDTRPHRLRTEQREWLPSCEANLSIPA